MSLRLLGYNMKSVSMAECQNIISAMNKTGQGFIMLDVVKNDRKETPEIAL